MSLSSQTVRPNHRQGGLSDAREREAGCRCWTMCKRVGIAADGRIIYRCDRGHLFHGHGRYEYQTEEPSK